jgi:hypothetical protein
VGSGEIAQPLEARTVVCHQVDDNHLPPCGVQAKRVEVEKLCGNVRKKLFGAIFGKNPHGCKFIAEDNALIFH